MFVWNWWFVEKVLEMMEMEWEMSNRWGGWRKGMDYRDRCENGNTIVIWNDTYGLFDGRR